MSTRSEAQEDEQEMDRPAREAVDVFADALVGVVDLAVGAQPVVLAALQVAVEEARGEPAPPLVGEAVAQVVIDGVDRHRDRQRRGHLAGLVVEHHGQLGFGQHQHDQEGQQGPGLFLLFSQPVGFCHADELLPCSERQGCGTAPFVASLRDVSGCGVLGCGGRRAHAGYPAVDYLGPAYGRAWSCSVRKQT
ncbi:hypothetical protein JN27_12775 [Massilia sp. BSC265]|nr:hypothetical protein JN27_12775 [Massilia sp. BSC265]